MFSSTSSMRQYDTAEELGHMSLEKKRLKKKTVVDEDSGEQFRHSQTSTAGSNTTNKKKKNIAADADGGDDDDEVSKKMKKKQKATKKKKATNVPTPEEVKDVKRIVQMVAELASKGIILKDSLADLETEEEEEEKGEESAGDDDGTGDVDGKTDNKRRRQRRRQWQQRGLLLQNVSQTKSSSHDDEEGEGEDGNGGSGSGRSSGTNDTPPESPQRATMPPSSPSNESMGSPSTRATAALTVNGDLSTVAEEEGSKPAPEASSSLAATSSNNSGRQSPLEQSRRRQSGSGPNASASAATGRRRRSKRAKKKKKTVRFMLSLFRQSSSSTKKQRNVSVISMDSSDGGGDHQVHGNDPLRDETMHTAQTHARSTTDHGGAGRRQWDKLKKELQSAAIVVPPPPENTVRKRKVLSSIPWMCSLCGGGFATEDEAAKHERLCVRRACNANDFFTETSVWIPSMHVHARPSTMFTGEQKRPSSVVPKRRSLTGLTIDSGSVASMDVPPPPPPNGISNPGWNTRRRSAMELKSILKPSIKDNRRVNSMGSLSVTSIASAAAANNSVAMASPWATATTAASATAATPEMEKLASGMVPMNNDVRRWMRMTDESVLKVVKVAQPYMQTSREVDAELELALWARDRSYYDHMDRRAWLRSRYSQSGKRGRNPLKVNTNNGILTTVKERLNNAYELITEGEEKADNVDRYEGGSSDKKGSRDIPHDDRTMYVNVLVKNSALVVSSEMERLADLRWQGQREDGNADPDNRFAQFRTQAQKYVVKLATLALENDFKPRRVAVQMSNDFYRLLGPELKGRGVRIELEIEYRVGAFFVLAVNVKSIDWMHFMEYNHMAVQRRMEADRLQKVATASNTAGGNSDDNDGTSTSEAPPPSDQQQKKKKKKKKRGGLATLVRLLLLPFMIFPSASDAISHGLYLLYYMHWIISLPICHIWYFFFETTTHTLILQSMVDDLYRYVERKGMEMDMQLLTTFDQAAFMLKVLREMRADEKKKKQKKEVDEEDGGKPLLGDLLGPKIREDKGAANPPSGFELPEALENICLELDCPVGFRRLRWAILSSNSEFMRRAIFEVEERYENINIGQWSVHDEHIGSPNASVDASDFVDAEREQSILIPANAMVKANTATEITTIIAYNDYCFAFKKRTSTPEVPFGGSFYTWTEVVVYDLGKDNCRIVCSSAAEFPNGKPMVARQIESGIRSGTTESFVRLGETICRYA